MEVPPDSLVMGTPAKVKRPVTQEERVRFRQNCDNYVRITAIYKEEQS
jgi:carbonic anhydrase/acetyltransferase-like protein (isoleucine patch superfamily)